MGRNAFRLMPLDETEQVLAEDFENHAHMDAVRALVLEVVEKGDDMSAARMGRIRRDESLQELDLIQGRFGVSWCRLDDFECHMSVHPREICSGATEEIGAGELRDTTQNTRDRTGTYLLSRASHTVLKCPQPSFLMMTYLWRRRQFSKRATRKQGVPDKVSPAIAELVPNVHGVVSTLHIVLIILLVFCHDTSRAGRCGRRRSKSRGGYWTVSLGESGSTRSNERIPNGCTNRYG